MKLETAWSKIEEYFQAIAQLREVQSSFNPARVFRGGGKSLVQKIEGSLGRKLPGEFRVYVEKYAPDSNVSFQSISSPFGPFFELYSINNLSLENTSPWEPSSDEKLSVQIPFALGADASSGAIVDLFNPMCPVYNSGELGLDLLAHNLADFFLILSFRELMFTTAELKNTSVDDWITYDSKEFEIAKDFIENVFSGSSKVWGL